MNDSANTSRSMPESPPPTNPYAAPSSVDEPIRPGIDDAVMHLPRWLRIREFFVVHAVVVSSTAENSIVSHVFDGGPSTQPWFVWVLGIAVMLGLPFLISGPARGLYLLYLGFHDRHLLWFAFGHFFLTVLQVAGCLL